ncbi:hypothetical protein J2S43_004173 [Catenuloplanes nepalensis]|uniref:Glycosyltransferase RgtA/B/C/D-like domain-containing protein n=1 Tax=Catenuloplanes nepalensis TaxID=587533 RepID=A0ABT9MWM1_9ACTN|nr:hypothetical protein [Catenuloplanes nepalensis]MDP9795661.1 hypothetical protein [Catenuloplanes nepalensis]
MTTPATPSPSMPDAAAPSSAAPSSAAPDAATSSPATLDAGPSSGAQPASDAALTSADGPLSRAGASAKTRPPATASPSGEASSPADARSRARRWLADLGPAVLAYLVLRLVCFAVLAVFARMAGTPIAAALTDFDATWYAGIATGGYDEAIPLKADGSLASTNLAFFPLFPALIALLDPILPGSAATAGVVLSWIAGLFAAAGLAAIGLHLRDRRTGIALAAVWAVLPHALVQSMGYSETLFTALAAWSLWALLRHQWLTAGLLCVLAGLTRPTGGALAVAVGLAALFAVIRNRGRFTDGGWRPWLAGALSPLGMLAFIGWVGLRLGQADGYFRVQGDAWGMAFDGGFYTLKTLKAILTDGQPLALYMATAVLAVAVLLLFLGFTEKLPWPLLVYAALVLALALGGEGYYHSKSRLLMPAFPLLIPVAYALARARLPQVAAVVAALTALSAWYGSYLALVWEYSP